MQASSKKLFILAFGLAGLGGLFSTGCYVEFDDPDPPLSPSNPQPEPPNPEPKTPKEPSLDPDVWDHNCKSIASTCTERAQSPQERLGCQTFEGVCIDADCGDLDCIELEPHPTLKSCLSSYEACANQAGTEADAIRCMGGFSSCVRADASFEAVGELSMDDLRACLDQGRICQASASTPQLTRTCHAYVQQCLELDREDDD